MINTVLILPIIFCIIILLTKNKTINNVLITLYAIFHGALSLFYITNPGIITNNKYFALSASNYIFYAILSIVFIAVAFYNNAYSKNMNFSDIKMSRYSAMILIFVLSMSGSILSNGIGLAWIFIEATTLASAYLIYFNKTKHSIEAAWKYVFICSIGIALAFVGIILLTIATGNMPSLHYTDLIGNAQNFDKFWLNTSFVFILFGIGTKMGLAPVHFWLPDAHSESPSPVSALLSAT
ncbi:MAG: proton-conducting transporter membrane subunit, partial [Candidatus Gastranaerophilaceae bacterium]